MMVNSMAFDCLVVIILGPLQSKSACINPHCYYICSFHSLVDHRSECGQTDEWVKLFYEATLGKGYITLEVVLCIPLLPKK